MKHIVVDLEMNNIRRRSEARKICTNEIIEIGASMLDENLWEIGKFQIYVKPEYNDVIVPKISKLTGITNEMVANAPTFSVAFKQFTDWCLNIKDDVMIYAWSNTDHSQVMKEIQLKQYKLSEEEHKLMEHGWTDFQNEFDIHLGFERQISLKLALDMEESTLTEDSMMLLMMQEIQQNFCVFLKMKNCLIRHFVRSKRL